MLFVTRSRYWHAGNGEAARTRALIEALAAACELTVFFPDPVDAAARAVVEACPHRYRLAVGNTERPVRDGVLAAMAGLCRQLRPDVVLLSRLQLDFLREHGRDGVPLYVFYPAGGASPVVLPQLLTAGIVLDAMGLAR